MKPAMLCGKLQLISYETQKSRALSGRKIVDQVIGGPVPHIEICGALLGAQVKAVLRQYVRAREIKNVRNVVRDF